MSNPHRSKDERGLLIYYQHIVNHLSVNHKFWINISNATDMPPYQTAAKCYTHKFLKRLLLLTPNRWFSSHRPLRVQAPSHLGMWDCLLAHTCSRTPGCPGCPPLRVGHSPREVTPHHKSAGPEVAPCWMWMSWRQRLGVPMGQLCCQAQADPMVLWGHVWQGHTSLLASLLLSSPTHYKSLWFVCFT